ncbi:DUF974 domain-containing protein [Rutstroemia sp. NJR-2017a WRK4]|nr:DUF974 domain-containing protein [Rutstroemia sp. NJR-2017a WRK4]
MSHQRNTSTLDGAKEPHSVSLKVLRLSRPSLSIQHPLPLPTPSPSPPSGSQHLFPAASASLAYPTTNPSNFILSPLLTLPPAFGSAYVGETFSCTLCANNEILPASPEDPTPPKSVTSISLHAEMKIPSNTNAIPLELSGPDALESQSLQKVLHFDLKEEGSHVLAVTVTYTESLPASSPDEEARTRVRTFRKLYQFVCKGCLIVRTKTGPLPVKSSVPGVKRYALEAQLENITEDNPITLTLVHLSTTKGFTSTSLNWEIVMEGEGEEDMERPVLSPGDVRQVCFLVEEQEEPEGEGEDSGADEKEIVDGRLIFGILSIGWRGAMGNKGFLNTGNLGVRVR